VSVHFAVDAERYLITVLPLMTKSEGG
jgi:hypothetical protein